MAQHSKFVSDAIDPESVTLPVLDPETKNLLLRYMTKKGKKQKTSVVSHDHTDKFEVKLHPRASTAYGLRSGIYSFGEIKIAYDYGHPAPSGVDLVQPVHGDIVYGADVMTILAENLDTAKKFLHDLYQDHMENKCQVFVSSGSVWESTVTEKVVNGKSLVGSKMMDQMTNEVVDFFNDEKWFEEKKLWHRAVSFWIADQNHGPVEVATWISLMVGRPLYRAHIADAAHMDALLDAVPPRSIVLIDGFEALADFTKGKDENWDRMLAVYQQVDAWTRVTDHVFTILVGMPGFKIKENGNKFRMIDSVYDFADGIVDVEWMLEEYHESKDEKNVARLKKAVEDQKPGGLLVLDYVIRKRKRNEMKDAANFFRNKKIPPRPEANKFMMG
jgi:hypothetical protein